VGSNSQPVMSLLFSHGTRQPEYDLLNQLNKSTPYGQDSLILNVHK